MNSLKLTGFSLALLVSTSLAHTAGAADNHGQLSSTDQTTMNSCMGMSSDAMMKNTGCMNVMKKMNMSEADTKMMMSCRNMANDAMMKNNGCSSMMKAHPELMMRGKP